MEPTLFSGESLLVNTFIYKFVRPVKGDIIAFQNSEKQYIIKRVAASSGDIIELQHNNLYINNEYEIGGYINDKNKQIFLQKNRFSPLIVPNGKVFVLGDNRSCSIDSRKVGFISMSNVIGRVVLPPSKHVY
ncbi:hypothetical protein GCM10008935_28070 [Alkalibacillus silvisoli]|uniref:Signal peptidase I n=2 Tax=Alkalibacillus silvisoli TaxID=392823 RepID=A0ABP3K3A3_9BACI